jgi:DNA-binding transcriptional MerR regulator
MSILDITEVTRQSGVPASTLRFYEEKGLITSVGRRGLHRLFDARVLEHLALIALGRVAGLSLDEIAPMLVKDGSPRIDRKVLARKADELDHTIAQLTAMRDGLRCAAACPAPSHMECKTFRRALRAAAEGAWNDPKIAGGAVSRGRCPRSPPSTPGRSRRRAATRDAR